MIAGGDCHRSRSGANEDERDKQIAINWDAGATLEKARVQQHSPGQYAILDTQAIWFGTLQGAIRQYLEKPASQRFLYDIIVHHDAGTERTLLSWQDIDALASRPDFPKEDAEAT